MGDHRPALPLPLRWIVAVLPGRLREPVGGDLEEGYRRRLERSGPAEARRWARREALRATVSALRLRLSDQRRRGVAEGWTPRRSRGTDDTGNGRTGAMGTGATGAGRARAPERAVHGLRQAWGGIRARKGASALVVATFALGIGLNTSLLSTASQLFLAPLPYPGGDRLVVPWPGHALPADLVAELMASPTFEEVAVFWDWSPVDHFDPDRPGTPTVGYQVGLVSRNYLDLFGVRPALGRSFVDEDVPPQDLWSYVHKVVLTHEAWTDLFGADPAVVGSTVPAGEVTTEIIGVMPPEATPLARGRDGWTVVAFMDQLVSDERRHFQIVSRLAPGVGLETAETELDSRLARTEARHGGSVLYHWSTRPSFGPRGSALEERTLAPLRSYLAGNVAGGMLLLVLAGGATLLVALVNATALALHRSVERSREVALRRVLGASRGRLATLVLSEQALLAGAGGAVALGLAGPGGRWLRHLLPEGLPFGLMADLGGHTVLWALVASCGCALASAFVALFPVLRAARDAEAGGHTSGTRSATVPSRTLGALLTVQLALVTVLLVGGGILSRTVQKLRAVEPGFPSAEIAVLEQQASGLVRRNAGRSADETLGAYFDRVVAALSSLPYVEAVGQGPTPMVSPLSADFEVTEGSRAPEPGRPDLRAGYRIVGAGDFFAALGVERIRGRSLPREEAAGSDGPTAAVVNDLFADALWPGGDPLGRTFHVAVGSGATRLFRVVGVVASIQDRALDIPAEPRFYTRSTPGRMGEMPFLVRVRGDVEGLMPGLVEAFGSVEPSVPLVSTLPLAAEVEASFRSRRTALQIVGVLAGVGLFLALLGVYGVASLNAAGRSREIGIRMALGARTASVLRLVLRQGAGWVAAGVAGGLAVAWWSIPALDALLYGVGPTDPLTFTAAPALLVVTALLAALGPAVRAARGDPARTLQEE